MLQNYCLYITINSYSEYIFYHQPRHVTCNQYLLVRNSTTTTTTAAAGTGASREAVQQAMNVSADVLDFPVADDTINGRTHLGGGRQELQIFRGTLLESTERGMGAQQRGETRER